MGMILGLATQRHEQRPLSLSLSLSLSLCATVIIESWQANRNLSSSDGCIPLRYVLDRRIRHVFNCNPQPRPHRPHSATHLDAEPQLMVAAHAVLGMVFLFPNLPGWTAVPASTSSETAQHSASAAATRTTGLSAVFKFNVALRPQRPRRPRRPRDPGRPPGLSHSS